MEGFLHNNFGRNYGVAKPFRQGICSFACKDPFFKRTADKNYLNIPN